MNVFGFADVARDGPTVFFRAGIFPEVGEVATLLRLHGLNRAIVADEKHTRATGLFLQSQPTPVMGQPGEALNEVAFAQFVERGQSRDFFASQLHLTRPAAAGRAALAIVKDGHNQNQFAPSTT